MADTDTKQMAHLDHEVGVWFKTHDSQIYGENSYLVLHRSSPPASFYTFAGVVRVDGGTGQHAKALRELISDSTTDESHWAVVGPAHDGERRMVLFRTSPPTPEPLLLETEEVEQRG